MREDIEDLAVGDRCLVCTGYDYQGAVVTRIVNGNDGPLAYEVAQDGLSPTNLILYTAKDIFGESLSGHSALRARLKECEEHLIYLQKRARRSLDDLQDLIAADYAELNRLVGEIEREGAQIYGAPSARTITVGRSKAPGSVAARRARGER